MLVMSVVMNGIRSAEMPEEIARLFSENGLELFGNTKTDRRRLCAASGHPDVVHLEQDLFRQPEQRVILC